MAQICTTRDQSKKLQELGVSTYTADMSWHFTGMKTEALQWELKTDRLVTKENFFGKIEKLATPFFKHADGSQMTGEEVFDRIWGKDIPAWSLGALIGILPSKVKDEKFTIDYYLTIGKDGVKYSNLIEDEENLYECYGELIECCVDMIETLIIEGYIKFMI